MKTWACCLLAGLAVLVVVAGVGGYLLGKRAGLQTAVSVRNRFMAERGLQGGWGAQVGTQGGVPMGAMSGRGGVSGTVKSVEGQTVIVTTQNGETKVQLAQDTMVQKMTGGTIQDIQPGQRVMVIGQADSSGVVTARSVQVLPGATP